MRQAVVHNRGGIDDFGAEQRFEAEAEALGFLGNHAGIVCDQASLAHSWVNPKYLFSRTPGLRILKFTRLQRLADVAQQGRLQKLGEDEGQVDIVAWAGYIERGTTDK